MAVSVYTGAGGGVASFNGRTGKVVPANGDYTKAQVGLGNVDNTSDANKPISKATQAALNNKQSKITANGILKGDGTGTITSADETEVELVDLPQEVFWAIYDETTYEELNAAYNAGKLIKVKSGNEIYSLSSITPTAAAFSCIYGSKGSYEQLLLLENDNSWMYFDVGDVIDTKRTITLPTASWTGSDPYTQTVTISGSTSNTKVDIQPSEELYDQLVTDNVGYLAIKNVNGTLTAVAKGGKPSVNLTVQVTYNNVY